MPAQAPLSSAGPRLRLGDLLVKKGLLSPAQLEKALEAQAKSGERLGKILVKNGYLPELDVTRTLAEQLGLTFAVSLEPDAEALATLPPAAARRLALIPLTLDPQTGVLKLATADPLNLPDLEEAERLTGHRIERIVVTRRVLERSLDRHFGSWMAPSTPASGGGAREDAAWSGTEAPAVALAGTILQRALDDRASDIHLEPGEKDFNVRHRIDGHLHLTMTLPKELLPPLISHLKISASLDIAEKRLPQDGHFTLGGEAKKNEASPPVALDGLGGFQALARPKGVRPEHNDGLLFDASNSDSPVPGPARTAPRPGDAARRRSVDVRVSTLPTVHGEKMVLRLLDQGALRRLDDLGFSRDVLKTYRRFIHAPYGMVLITGPTGSGKSTTLMASLLDLGPGGDQNIVTVEDPVEYLIPGISQVQVNARAGLTFARALRSILRQDPDVIMLGEIRDGETAENAVRAALTGHLVLSTLHANDSPGAPGRLNEMGVEPYLVASSLSGIVSQRLVRHLCRCRASRHLAEGDPLLLALDAPPGVYWFPTGCSRCAGTGFLGRVPLWEVMPLGPSLRRLILEKTDVATLRTAALREGFVSLEKDGVAKAAQGLTSLAEVRKATFHLEG